jgi:S1-C subfamily serine protease
VQEVANGSSEEVAGVRGARQVVAIGNVELGIGGDLIVAVDGKPVDREDALVRAISQKRVGDTLILTVVRDGKNVAISMKLLRPPADLG